MADNDFMVCPSQMAGGRTDQCGQYSYPRTCWFDNCCMPDTKPPFFDAKGRAIPAHPIPSITVGTQVRLTGVVTSTDTVQRDHMIVDIGHPVGLPMGVGGTSISVKPEALEVIRQPFKRGEVVWSCGAVATGIAYQVLADEAASGDVLLIKESDEGGHRSFVAHHSDFERRP